MKKYLKITAIITVACMQQSYGMLSRAAMSMHTKRFAPAMLAQAKNVPLRSLATRNVLLEFMPKKQEQKNNKQQFNWGNKNYFTALGAVGTSLLIASKVAHADELPQKPEVAKYINPREAEKQRSHQRLMAKPWGKLAEQIIKEHEKQEQDFIEEFLKLCGIEESFLKQNGLNNHLDYWQFIQLKTVASYKDFVHTQLNKDKKKLKLVDQPIDFYIRNILGGFEMNTDRLNIFSDPDNSMMGCYEDGLLVNQSNYAKSSDNEKRSWLIHESKHMIHNEHFNQAIMISMAKGFSLNHLGRQYKFEPIGNSKAFKNFFWRYRSFCEQRADIQAALEDPEIAKTQRSFFSKHKKDIMYDTIYTGVEFGYRWWTMNEHPYDWQRAETANKLYNQMLDAMIESQTHVV